MLAHCKEIVGLVMITCDKRRQCLPQESWIQKSEGHNSSPAVFASGVLPDGGTRMPAELARSSLLAGTSLSLCSRRKEHLHPACTSMLPCFNRKSWLAHNFPIPNHQDYMQGCKVWSHFLLTSACKAAVLAIIDTATLCSDLMRMSPGSGQAEVKAAKRVEGKTFLWNILGANPLLS